MYKRQLYIGSEGTLGIITAATLKLFPRPVASCTALLTLDSIDNAVELLSRARAGFGAALTGFELMSGDCLQAVVRLFPQQRLPFEGASAASPWFALLELSDSESEAHARERFETVLGEAIEAGLVNDAAIAANVAQSKALWHLRESIPLAEAELGKSVKHDVSIPISAIAGFVHQTNALLQAVSYTHLDHAEHAAAVIQRKGHRAHALPGAIPRHAGGDPAQGALDRGRQMRRRAFGDQHAGVAPDTALPGAARGQFALGRYEYMNVEPAFPPGRRPDEVRGRPAPAPGAAR